MSTDSVDVSAIDWRRELPVLAAHGVTLREVVADDRATLVGLLGEYDAGRFAIDGHIDAASVAQFIDRAIRDRAAGASFTYVVVVSSGCVGLTQVRQLTPAFEAAEWEMVLTPAARGTGIFLETAQLVGSFVFNTLGAHRLEARVLRHNGRAMGALRKLGAVQEGILRRSIRSGNAYLDQLLWSILKEDWSDPQAAIAPRVH